MKSTITPWVQTEVVDPINTMIEKIDPQYQIEDLHPATIDMFKQAIPEPSSDESPSDKVVDNRRSGILHRMGQIWENRHTLLLL